MTSADMKLALQEHFVPQLRARGFKGSLPHFRRVTSTGVDLLTVQFDKWGGGFVIEIARCGPLGATMSWGEVVPASKVTAHHLDVRHRLGAPSLDEDGRWFRYDDGTPPAEVAREAVDMLAEADTWWRDHPP
jgi:hypothetical protein